MKLYIIGRIIIGAWILITGFEIVHLQNKVTRMNSELYRKEHEIEVLQKNFKWLLKDYEASTHRPIRWWE
jgi:heme/copper-type cytochrome/quinol oxidase subunit 2